MKPVTANYLNAIVLIAAGLYGYFLLPLGPDEKRSVTALIPAFSGVVFLILGAIWSSKPKVAAHIAAVLALVLVIMCVNRFIKIDDWGAKKYVFLICILSNLLALVIFIRSFIQARVVKKA
ncbi:MAG: hypothetical protein KIT80_04730 [Chitinophagaceae bacterium]|nr:hypothetical protein [Chitinophagaceae bacterium]MCW5926197.1 hypothetical protein [Chitinophagaceae bacterium]